jgi:hypothetical protein
MASGSSSNNNEENNSNSRVYSCNYCHFQFPTQQALAGHQNAHKAQRAFEKQLKERYDGQTSNLGQPLFNQPFNNTRSFLPPYSYRSLGVRNESMIDKQPPYSYRSSLGVRNESMIHKQPSVCPIIGHGGGLSLTDVFNPSLINLKNNNEGSTKGVEIQGIGGATTSRTEDHGTNFKFYDFLNLGVSSDNVGTSSNSTTAKKNIQNSKSKDEDESSDSGSSELDLTLKL